MTSQRRRLLELLRETSFEKSDQPIFHLASGIDSNYYIDCKQALSYPEARQLIGELIYVRIRNEPLDAIGGLEIGAYPIACAVSDRLYLENAKTARVFVVRKEAKKHGIRTLLAGDARNGDIALIVDDVITSGSSAIQAIKNARAEGLQVRRVIAIVDREESDGKANIEREGVSFEALFTLAELISEYGESERSDQGARRRRPIGGTKSPRLGAVGS